MTIAAAALCSLLWSDDANAVGKREAAAPWVPDTVTRKPLAHEHDWPLFAIRALNRDQSGLTAGSVQRDRGAVTGKVDRYEPAPAPTRPPQIGASIPWISSVIRLLRAARTL
jgi:hypothetical protein